MDHSTWFEKVAGNSPRNALALREELLHLGLLDRMHEKLATRTWEHAFDQECVAMLGCLARFEREKGLVDREQLRAGEKALYACTHTDPLVCTWWRTCLFATAIRLKQEESVIKTSFGLANYASQGIESDIARHDVLGFLHEEGARWLHARSNADGAWEHWKQSAEARLRRYHSLELDSAPRTTFAAASATLVRMYAETETLFLGRRADEFPIKNELVRDVKEIFGNELTPATLDT